MKYGMKSICIQNMPSKSTNNYERYVNPMDITVPPGYSIEVYAYGLDTPISMQFDDQGDMLIGDAGVTSDNPKVLRQRGNQFDIIADGFHSPLTGITYHNGDIFVSHRGKITVIRPDGSKEDALSGLPSFGDHQNNQVVFGADGKMYFGQGTATNSGVVGLDNTWIMQHPQFHDYAGTRITLNGCNFITDNIFTEAKDYAYTAAFSPFGEPNFYPNEEIRGYIKASGSILRANPDGSALEQVVWGLRNPFRLKFDISNRLFSTNLGADVRGSRPIANCVDEFQMIQSGIWYGWPDYNGGLPVTLPEFTPEGGPPLTLLINTLPNIPPKPFAVFQPHSTIMGFDFNYNPDFDNYGDAYVAEFGSEAPFTTGGKPDPNVGHKVTRIDMTSGTVSDFAVNKSGLAAFESGSGGFERPSDVVFGPDGAMYVLDFGVSKPGEPGQYYKGSGVIWRIARIS